MMTNRSRNTIRLLANLSVASVILAQSSFASAAGGYSEPASSPESAMYARADRLIKSEDYAAAIVELKKIVASSPDEADAENLLGYSYRMLRDYANSEIHYRAALQIDPDHRKALNYSGHLYLETNRPQEAQAALARLDEICFLGCPEYSELKEAIAAHGGAE